MDRINWRLWGPGMVLLAAGLAACGDSNTTDGGSDAFGQPCTHVFDCPPGFVCAGGHCIPPQDVGPGPDADADGDLDADGTGADGDGDLDADGTGADAD
ncbi:MAG: hypothetical protein JXB32_10560, partial [Deltaproteobacteria bacterium]|nr:hypothetical protein [Deltaproteobacteria bacterium]